MNRKVYHLGLIGWPLEHSLSPAIHQAALRSLGLEGHYRLIPVPPLPEGTPRILEVIHRIRQGELDGFNLTIPHKRSLLQKLDRLTPAANAIGAVNTVFKEGEGLVGDNTDKEGFLMDLEAALGPEVGAALVLGGGGAARAVVYGLSEVGWEVWVAARRIGQAVKLAGDLRPSGGGRIRPIEFTPGAIGEAVKTCSLIVNATPLGMAPEVGASPWPGELPLPKGAVVYDLVYAPQETAFTRAARAQGLRVANGLGMLVEQAALAFECWTGVEAPRGAMYNAARNAVDRRDHRGRT